MDKFDTKNCYILHSFNEKVKKSSLLGETEREKKERKKKREEREGKRDRDRQTEREPKC